MNKLSNALAIAGLILTLPLALYASTISADKLHDQIQFFEYSVTQSSVSPTLSEQRKSEKLDLLDDARQQVDMGNFRTAEGLLKRVAQNLYSMSPAGQETTRTTMSPAQAEAIWTAMESILPQARKIAREKQAGQQQLDRVMQDHQLARAALESNDLATASSLLQGSYRMLKQNVAELRSGDWLMIALPAADTREGWMDAAHRYIDWRYFNRQLISTMEDSGMNAGDIDQATLEADQIYGQASNIALQGDWEQAVATLDRAYQILEKAWLRSGVNFGI